MAHNLEINGGIASYVENGRQERAWHNLGQVFDGPMTVQQALELSHADYNVQLQPIAALTPDILKAMENGETIDSDLLLSSIIAGRKATMRMDKEKPLGVVSDSYGIVQNADAFRFIDTLCSGEMGNEHTHCLVTPTRVVCNNTLNYAMANNAGKLALRHSANIMSRLDLSNKENADFAFKAMNMYNIYKTSLEQSFEHLQNIRLADRDLDNILAEVLLSDANLDIYHRTGDIRHPDMTSIGKNLVEKVRDTLYTGVGQEYCETGTGMWLINGLTTYYQNEANYKSDEYKFDSIMQGQAARKLQKAYELVV